MSENVEKKEKRQQRNAEFAEDINKLLVKHEAHPIEIIIIACKLLDWHIALPNEKYCQKSNGLLPGLIMGQDKYLMKVLDNSNTTEDHITVTKKIVQFVELTKKRIKYGCKF